MKQLDPKAVWLFFLSLIPSLVFPMVILFFWSFSFFGTPDDGFEFSLNVLNWLWLIIPIVLILNYLWAKLTYRFYKYELTELGFRKELGVIYKQYVTIPYDRIQNVDIYRGILARILGLSDLNIQTAGSSAGMIGGEGRLPGLSKEMAEQLRDELLQRAKGARSQGL